MFIVLSFQPLDFPYFKKLVDLLQATSLPRCISSFNLGTFCSPPYGQKTQPKVNLFDIQELSN
jgi:hypothetical protein